MKCLCVLLMMFAQLCLPVFSAENEERNRKILSELDETIASKGDLHTKREAEIQALKDALEKAMDNREKFALCNSLFNAYLHYQADSALYYLDKKTEYMPAGRPELKTEISINRADAMGVMGMYNEAMMLLEKIDARSMDDRLLNYYYGVCRRIEGWRADYTPDIGEKRKYLIRSDSYRDSILMLLRPDINADVIHAEKMILRQQPDSAIRLLEHSLKQNPNDQQQIYIYYTLADAYRTKYDTENRIHCLAQTAILDLKKAVREYAALQQLARLVYEQGDLERAYRYLKCAMEDAVACNARLRFLEVTEFYPIIDKEYARKESNERNVMRTMLISVSILAFLLVALSIWMWHWNKKISSIRRNLYTANGELQAVNEKLQTVNEELAQTGKIKETYIAHYLKCCVGYLKKMEQHRRSWEKLVMTAKRDELLKAIRSEQFLRDERKAFYDEFDKAFLDLFPMFVKELNNLLTEDGQIFPKSNELLNTELRIFALMRLGITDTTQIAHFLDCSAATVYSYRSKIRNRAKGDKDTFEQKVMNL